jgi:hypothetical protein
MINILEIDPDTNSAMSMYRGRLPLIRLCKKYRDIQFTPGGRNVSTEWDFLNLFDIVFMMRPTEVHHLNIIKACNNFNIPVWIDYDDLLTNIPQDNPAYFVHYNSKDYKAVIDQILMRCTFATFSTKKLMETMAPNILKKSTVIPNAMDLEMFRKPKLIGTGDRILWRGGTTHKRDIYEFSGPIRETLRGSGWIAEFMAYNPIEITEYIDCEYTPYMNKADYFNRMANMNSKISIVPLSHKEGDIQFNQSKSNIAWMESTYAGMAVLAPNWDEWRRPGIVNYTDKKDFAQKLNSMMNGEYDLESLRQASWNFIRTEISLEKTNVIRYELLKQHLKGLLQ